MRYERYNPPLCVVGFVATRASETDRGPLIRMRGEDARLRLLQDGELVWLYGPRRHELVTVRVDSFPFQPLTPIAGALGVGTWPITRQATFRWERGT